jgi:hypothetical protein
MSTLFSCFFFTLLSLNPHSAHLYIIESPISFSGSMSPPQHAHFMTIKRHKDEILFLSLVFLAIGGICISLLLFLLLFGRNTGISERCFQLYFSPLYNNNLEISIRQETVVVMELDRNKTRRFYRLVLPAIDMYQMEVFGCSD